MPPKPRVFQRLIAAIAERRLLSDRKLLEWYPPFLWMRIKVLEMSDNWRRVRIRLPLNSVSRNPGGARGPNTGAGLCPGVSRLFDLDPCHDGSL